MTGDTLKQWRQQLKLSQPAFAALADVHAMTISRWERCTGELNPQAHKKLRAVYERLTTPVQPSAQMELPLEAGDVQ